MAACDALAAQSWARWALAHEKADAPREARVRGALVGHLVERAAQEEDGAHRADRADGGAQHLRIDEDLHELRGADERAEADDGVARLNEAPVDVRALLVGRKAQRHRRELDGLLAAALRERVEAATRRSGQEVGRGGDGAATQ